MVGAKSAALFASRMSNERSADELRSRKIGVPSRAFTSNLEFRTLPLCNLSYGDKSPNPWPVSSTSSHPALSKVATKMKGLGRSIYFAFRGSKWRNAVDLHHLPEGTHSLAPRPGSLDRLTFQIGPRGRTCTCNLSVLSGTPLHWATRGGAHGRICTGTVRVLSAPSLRWTTWAKWPAGPKLGAKGGAA